MKITRKRLGSSLSAFEFFDRQACELLISQFPNNAKLPFSQHHPFYLLVEVTSSDQNDGFDDRIPKLPDLGWASDQGEIDPMGRLSKAESAVFDASQQDLMSDL